MLLLLVLLGLLGSKTIEGNANWGAMAKVAGCVARHKMTTRRVVTLFVLAIFAGDMAEIAHVTTRQILAVEGLFRGQNWRKMELVKIVFRVGG